MQSNSVEWRAYSEACQCLYRHTDARLEPAVRGQLLSRAAELARHVVDPVLRRTLVSRLRVRGVSL